MESKTLIFNLSEELEFSTAGAFSKTSSIELAAPSMGCFKESSDFQQLVARAFMSLAQGQTGIDDQDSVDQSKKPNAAEIKVILLSSPSVKFSDVADSFKSLALKVATFDGAVHVKKDHFAKVDISDFVNMICEYVETFIFPSLFPEL